MGGQKQANLKTEAQKEVAEIRRVAVEKVEKEVKKIKAEAEKELEGLIEEVEKLKGEKEHLIKKKEGLTTVVMITKVKHNGKEYEIDDVCPDDLVKLFIGKGFAVEQ